MGQEVAATPLQIVTATCAIANGGKLMLPQIVSEIIDDEGRTIAQFPPQRICAQQREHEGESWLMIPDGHGYPVLGQPLASVRRG
jgi:membrane carboxypeptidase/penicillin-binding protein